MPTYYVAIDGSDIVGDGTSANPWATIDWAVGRAAAGDTIYMKPGTYEESWVPTALELNNKTNLTIEKDPAIAGAVTWGGIDGAAGLYSFYFNGNTNYGGMIFKNITFQTQAGMADPQELLYIKAPDAENSSVAFNACVFTDPGAMMKTHDIWVQMNGATNISDYTFTNCTFQNIDRGLRFDGAGNLSFLSCTFNTLSETRANYALILGPTAAMNSFSMIDCTWTNLTGLRSHIFKVRGDIATLTMTGNNATNGGCFLKADTDIAGANINIDGTSWTISDNIVSGASLAYYLYGPADGSGGANITIENNTFTRTSTIAFTEYGLTLGQETSDDTIPIGNAIVRNNIFDCTAVSALGAGDVIQIGGGATNSIIEGNTILASGADTDLGIVLKGLDQIVRHNSVVCNITGSSINLVSARSAKVYNNVFYGTSGCLQWNQDIVAPIKDPADNEFYNNIVYVNGAAAVGLSDGDNALYSLYCDHNLYYVPSGFYGEIHGTNASSLEQLRSLWNSEYGSNNDAHSVFGDPEFLDFTGSSLTDDFHVSDTSPALRAGWPGPYTDIGIYQTSRVRVRKAFVPSEIYMTRFEIYPDDVDYGAEYYEFQIRVKNQLVQYDPYPIHIISYDNPYIDLYLTPFTDHEVRIRQYGGTYPDWSYWTEADYTHYTSFDKARILSGLDVVMTSSRTTNEGETITASSDDNGCENTSQGVSCS